MRKSKINWQAVIQQYENHDGLREVLRPMNGLLSTLNSMSIAKKMTLAASVLLTVVMTLYMAQVSQRTDMALLYAGLEGRAAGDVITQLDQMGVNSEIRGSAVYVDRAERDRVRMLLASSGLPASGQQGYELLDGLSGFGTTAEMFDAAYWRAKEGELARTLVAAPAISQARVHIGTPRRRSFSTVRPQPTASVTLSGASGPVDRNSAMSARYLVSLAVPGLDSDQVAVIDSANGVILRPGDDAGGLSGFADAERAQKMKEEVAALLAARVGEGRARVSVNVETTRESETISRRIIDPESRALRETSSVELAETGEGSAANATVASNLPDGDAAGGERSSSRDENRKTDVFDYTETREEVLRPAGSIKRITVAVLLDEIRSVADDGTATSEPRSRDEIEKLENLVKSAVGFDEERGDTVTVESISFAEVPQDGTVVSAGDAAPSFVETNLMSLIQVAVLGLVALILGLFVVRPVLMAGQQGASPALESEEDVALSAIDVTPQSASMDDLDFSGGMGMGGMGTPEMDFDMEPSSGGNKTLELLRDTVGSRGDESAEVIRGWLEDGTGLEKAS